MSPDALLRNHLAGCPFVIFGHRGAAGLAPENTLKGFAVALAHRVPMIELDVHRVHAADGTPHLYVIHDDKVDRTTNGSGRLADLSTDLLAQLDAGEGEQVPTLAAVFDLLTTHNRSTARPTGLNIELKGRHTAELVAEALTAAPALPVLVSSFDHAELERFRAAAPGYPVAPLFDKWREDCWQIADDFGAFSVNWAQRVVTKTRVAAAVAAGLPVFVYTVNGAADARRLAKLGVSGIFTDRPDRMRRWLD